MNRRDAMNAEKKGLGGLHYWISSLELLNLVGTRSTRVPLLQAGKTGTRVERVPTKYRRRFRGGEAFDD
jgi:hypothetical protein